MREQKQCRGKKKEEEVKDKIQCCFWWFSPVNVKAKVPDTDTLSQSLASHIDSEGIPLALMYLYIINYNSKPET